jgi:hypothetical protein
MQPILRNLRSITMARTINARLNTNTGTILGAYHSTYSTAAFPDLREKVE